MIGLVSPSIIKEATCSYNIISFYYANYFKKKNSFSLIFSYFIEWFSAQSLYIKSWVRILVLID